MDSDGLLPGPSTEQDDNTATPSKSFVDRLSKFKFVHPSTPRQATQARPLPSHNQIPPSTPTKKRARTAITTPNRPSGSSKKRRPNAGYEPPRTFAHLNLIPDRIKNGLDILFCGINPGVVSASRGFHFAHPNNCFYRVLHEAGLTDRRLAPDESPTLPDQYNMGLTDLVARPSASSSQLSKAEKVEGVPELLHKISLHKPRVVCFIGKEIADAVDLAVRRHLRSMGQSDIGLRSPVLLSTAPRKAQNGGPPSQYISPLVNDAPGFRFMPIKMVYVPSSDGSEATPTETLFFTSPSTSGLVTQYRLEDRVQLFKLLKASRDAILAGSEDAPDTSRFIVIPVSLYCT